MRLSRRSFNKLSIAVTGVAMGGGTVVSGAIERRGVRSSSLLRWSSVGDRAGVVFEQGGNVLAVNTGKGVVVIDCKNPGIGGALRQFIEASHASNVVGVINTHHHADHTGGNPGFASDELLMAHPRCGERIGEQTERYASRLATMLKRLTGAGELETRARADIERLLEMGDELGKAFTPARLLTKPFESVRFGEVEVHLHHVGPGHTDNDVFVHIPSLNLLHTGDLVFNSFHPYIDKDAGATTDGWRASLGAMAALCDAETVVVPGHGEVSDVSAITAQDAYFARLRELAEDAHQQKLSRDETMKMSIAFADDYGFGQLKARNLGFAYDEVAKNLDAEK